MVLTGEVTGEATVDGAGADPRSFVCCNFPCACAGMFARPPDASFIKGCAANCPACADGELAKLIVSSMWQMLVAHPLTGRLIESCMYSAFTLLRSFLAALMMREATPCRARKLRAE